MQKQTPESRPLLLTYILWQLCCFPQQKHGNMTNRRKTGNSVDVGPENTQVTYKVGQISNCVYLYILPSTKDVFIAYLSLKHVLHQSQLGCHWELCAILKKRKKESKSYSFRFTFVLCIRLETTLCWSTLKERFVAWTTVLLKPLQTEGWLRQRSSKELLVRKLQSQEMEKLCSLKVPTSITMKSSLFPLQMFLGCCFFFFPPAVNSSLVRIYFLWKLGKNHAALQVLFGFFLPERLKYSNKNWY